MAIERGLREGRVDFAFGMAAAIDSVLLWPLAQKSLGFSRDYAREKRPLRGNL
jgi:hypothetical protein